MPATQTAQSAQSQPSDLGPKIARFAPTDIAADVSKLSAPDRRVLAKLVEASKMIDALFLRQVWFGNDAMLVDLARDESPDGRERLHYFLINKGPWSRLDHDEPFVPGAPPKPEGANFYPAGATKAEIEKWIQSLPEAERARATGFFTVVRRAANGQLHARPVQPRVSERAGARGRAAARGRRPVGRADARRRFSRSARDAFLSNDYYDSDVAWMELKGAIEPTIGPYEVYEDEFFNYKAAFESFITVRDDVEIGQAARSSAASCRTSRTCCRSIRSIAIPKLGGLAPLVVVNDVFAAGDANRGVQTAAFNLPNDERVLREKGAKRVMLKNVQDAKFAKILVPISKVVLAADRPGQRRVRRLLHAHPDARADARPRAAQHHRRRACDDRAPGDEGDLELSRGSEGRHLRPVRAPAPRSTRASCRSRWNRRCTRRSSRRRSGRSGSASTRRTARASRSSSTTCSTRAASSSADDGTFAVDTAKIKDGVVALTREIMTIQAEGNYAKAKALGDRLGIVRPPVQAALDKLTERPGRHRAAFHDGGTAGWSVVGGR